MTPCPDCFGAGFVWLQAWEAPRRVHDTVGRFTTPDLTEFRAPCACSNGKRWARRRTLGVVTIDDDET